MSDLIKCQCASCGAKYRLPAEFQGRVARCKKCGAKFRIPQQRSLEDSVLDWLMEAETEHEEETVEPPRVIRFSEQQTQAADPNKLRGPIRFKNASPQQPNSSGTSSG